MRVGEAIAKLFSAQVLVRVIGFVGIAVFIQQLGAGAMGSFFLFQAFLGIIGIPADLGVSKATEKSLSSQESDEETILNAILLKTALLLPWILVMLLFEGHIEGYIGVDGVVIFTAIGLFSSQFRQLSVRILAGQMEVAKIAPLRAGGKFVWFITSIILIKYGLEEMSIIIGLIISDIFLIATSSFRADIKYGAPSKSKMVSLIDFGRYVFIGSVGGYMYSWMDVAILRFFVPTSLIGAYEIAWRVASVSMILTTAVRESIFPQVSKWHEENSYYNIQKGLSKWLQIPLFITIPALTGGIIFGEEILSIFFNIDVGISYIVLIIFLSEKILRSVHLILSPCLFAMDKPELGYRGSIASIIANLILNISLIPILGLLGAAMATTISAGISAGINYIYLSRFISLALPWRRIYWICLSAIVMAVCVLFIKTYLPLGLLGLVIGISSGVLIYTLAMVINSDIRIDIRRFAKSLGDE